MADAEQGARPDRDVFVSALYRTLEAEHQAILSAALDGFWMVDSGSRLVVVNDAYCRMSGYSRDELLRMTIAELDARETAEAVTAHHAAIVAKGADRFETVHRRKDGSTFEVDVSVQVHPTRPGVTVAFVRDISERRRAEREVAREHALLENLARLVPGVIYQYRLDPDGHSAFPYASPGMELIYEVTPEEVREDASPVFGRLHPEDALRVSDAIFRSADTLEPFFAEFRVLLPKQGLRWRWSQAQPQRLPDGGTLWHGIILDVHERKQAQLDRETLATQLQHAQRMETVGRLAGGVAHDFNNMLGVILGRIEMSLASLDASQDDRREHLLEIHAAATRSADLTRQLLAFARKQVVEPKILDLNDTLAGMVRMLQRLIGENIRFVWEPAFGVWPVKMDPSQLDQVLVNLCVNARDAIAETGTVQVTLANVVLDARAVAGHMGVEPGEYVRLTVSDTGCGMDAHTLAHALEPFFTTKPQGKGTGLGLATVEGVAGQNGGFVTVASSPGAGTSVFVHLPRCAEVRTDAGSTPAEDDLLMGTETILLVEDEPSMLRVMTVVLEGLGYTVLPASTPETAQAAMAAHAGSIALVVTDVIMPGMNGADLVRALRVDYPDLRALFMSGYTADTLGVRGVIESGVHFIQKPFSRRTLGLKLREVLGA